MKILLAVDGSRHARWAEAWLGVSTGKPHAVEVFYVTPAVLPGTAGAPSVTEALRDNGRRMVEAVAAGFSRRFKTTTRVEESHDVAGTLPGRAESLRAGLMVMGARGLTPLKTFFLGSVSHRVSRHAKIPVLVARRPPRKSLRVLAAVDGSAESLRALNFLDTFGLPSNARLTLVHVVSEPVAFWIPETGFPGGYGNVAAYQESLKALRARGEQLLLKARKSLSDRFASVQTRLMEGHPAGNLLKAAERADVIGMGHLGLSAGDRGLMGAGLAAVSSHAACCVVLGA